MKKRSLIYAASMLCVAAGFATTSSFAGTSSIILDGDFLDSIGTGNNLTPWSDWTNAGVTRHPAPNGIQGNYASLPVTSYGTPTVPEPSTWAMMLLGFAGLSFVGYRTSRRGVSAAG